MATNKTPSLDANKKSPQSVSSRKALGTQSNNEQAPEVQYIYPRSIDPVDIPGLFDRLSTPNGSEPDTAEPNAKFNKKLEEDISAIFAQAKDHRHLLIRFFIWYTCILSVFVLTIVFIQVFARIYIPDSFDLEVVPQWVLYLLVIGMFGQFIGLLTIVTTKVWTFEPFFRHYRHNHHPQLRDEEIENVDS